MKRYHLTKPKIRFLGCGLALLLGSAIFSLLPVGASLAASANVYFSPSSGSYKIHKQFSVKLEVSDSRPWRSATISFKSSNNLTYVGYAITNGSGTVTSSGRTATVSFNRSKTHNPPSSLAIVTLSYKTNAAGNASLDIINAQDNYGALTSRNASYSISRPAPAPAPKPKPQPKPAPAPSATQPQAATSQPKPANTAKPSPKAKQTPTPKLNKFPTIKNNFSSQENTAPKLKKPKFALKSGKKSASSNHTILLLSILLGAAAVAAAIVGLIYFRRRKNGTAIAANRQPENYANSSAAAAALEQDIASVTPKTNPSADPLNQAIDRSFYPMQTYQPPAKTKPQNQNPQTDEVLDMFELADKFPQSYGSYSEAKSNMAAAPNNMPPAAPAPAAPAKPAPQTPAPRPQIAQQAPIQVPQQAPKPAPAAPPPSQKPPTTDQKTASQETNIKIKHPQS
ncbi:MAG: hypothetical protein ACREGA_01065 [Candidatus Saccharimonadales bacterium]